MTSEPKFYACSAPVTNLSKIERQNMASTCIDVYSWFKAFWAICFWTFACDRGFAAYLFHEHLFLKYFTVGACVGFGIWSFRYGKRSGRVPSLRNPQQNCCGVCRARRMFVWTVSKVKKFEHELDQKVGLGRKDRPGMSPEGRPAVVPGPGEP